MNSEQYFKSGIIELYVMGLTSAEESAEVERLALLYPEINDEIERVTDALVKLSEAGRKINPDTRAMLMATIDYTERLRNGEPPELPPLLHGQSSPTDFSTWLNRPDMVFDEDYGDIYVKIIGSAPDALTGIVWLKTGALPETHDKEYERFLILEGSCDIVTSANTFSLVPGSYFQIPLHVEHSVVVTSEVPCKLILQRVAA